MNMRAITNEFRGAKMAKDVKEMHRIYDFLIDLKCNENETCEYDSYIYEVEEAIKNIRRVE